MKCNAQEQINNEQERRETLKEQAWASSLFVSQPDESRGVLPIRSHSIPTLPDFPVNDMENSLTAGPVHRYSSGSIGKPNESFYISASVPSHGNRSSVSKCGSLCIAGNVTESLDRVINMVQTYPLMSVKNTVFENQISHQSKGDEVNMSMTVQSYTSISIDDAETEGSVPEETDALGSMHSQGDVVSAATRLKRALMWETIIVNALVHRAWLDQFCRFRLRAVLEKHMLPVILRKRENGSLSKKFVWRSQQNTTELLGESEGLRPEGVFIKEQLQFLVPCGTLDFYEAIAEVVLRYRYSPGDAIVTVGTPAQNALYILYSGRCDAITPAVEGKQSVKRVRVMPGETFGGLYGGSEVFRQLYRAISECIVWVIRREDFEILFDQCADKTMQQAYIEALKKYTMERLQQNYSLPHCMSRVPIYRLLDVTIDQYVKDFTPLVLTKGEVLFHQGDPPGTVYCLLEGQVERAQLGHDMTYETGTSQILSPNDSDNSFALSTRFVLLGEEPHIVPSPLRYKCTVHSRIALFFKIEGGSFVNALLDDAKLFIQIRAKLTTQIRQSMKLAPEAILSVPLFADWPRSHVNAILNAAEARVVDRALPICEPAQPIREIFLLTAGGLRDPRQFDHMPLQPDALPNVSNEEPKENLVFKGKQGKSLDTLHEKELLVGTHSAFADTTGTAMRSQLRDRMEDTSRGGETHSIRWSYFCCENDESGMNIIYPDEHQELSPPLPPNPTRNILYAVGGGWEGLLVEKWPNGWETTTTVELWAVPTLNIRVEFNSMPKSTQSVILQNARQMQMLALGLSAPVVTKLPPMSVFLPHEKRLTKHGLGLEKGGAVQEKTGVHEKSTAAYSRRHAGSGQSHEHSTTTGGSKQGRMTADFSNSRVSTLSGSSVIFSALGTGTTPRNKASIRRLPNISSNVLPADKVSASATKKEKDLHKVMKVSDVSVSADAMLSEVPKLKAGPPPLPFFRKLISKPVEEPPVITDELCAVYAGQKPPNGIIRGPQPLKKKQELFTKGCLLAMNQEPNWPIGSGSKKQWFREVPNFAPLPGTINNQNHTCSVPRLLPNTALMAKREKGYGGVLVSQANYFLSLAHSRREKAIKSKPTSSDACVTVKRSPSPERAALSNLTSRPVPGRHAYRL